MSPHLYVLYKNRSKKVGGGYVRRHWAFLISESGTPNLGVHIDVIGAGLGGGVMKLIVNPNFDTSVSNPYGGNYKLLSELAGDYAFVMSIIEATSLPNQKFVDGEFTPGCQAWCHQVVEALVEHGMVSQSALNELALVPSRE